MLEIIIIFGNKNTFKRTVVFCWNVSYTLFFSKFSLIAYFYTLLERSGLLVSMQYFEYIEVKYQF